jgi:hypothetical protein
VLAICLIDSISTYSSPIQSLSQSHSQYTALRAEERASQFFANYFMNRERVEVVTSAFGIPNIIYCILNHVTKTPMLIPTPWR